MISSAATSTVLKLTQVCGRQIWIEQLPSTTGILTALQFLCLYSAYLHSVLFKKQRHRIDGKDSCSLCLSLSTTPFPLSFLPKAFTALQSPSRSLLLTLTPPSSPFTWESIPGMPDVLQSEAQQCKHWVLPWMPGGLALPLSTLHLSVAEGRRISAKESEWGRGA